MRKRVARIGPDRSGALFVALLRSERAIVGRRGVGDGGGGALSLALVGVFVLRRQIKRTSKPLVRVARFGPEVGPSDSLGAPI